MAIYTEETKKELEESIRSIDGVTNILWRWDPWEGCTCLRFKVGKRSFRITFSRYGIPIAYYYLNGYWRINATKGNYSPLEIKQVVNTLCIRLDQYETKDTREQIIAFVNQSDYDYSEIFEELEEERMIYRLAGAYIREYKIEVDKDGIMLEVIVALFYKTMVHNHEEAERIKHEKGKKRREHKNKEINQKHRKKKKHQRK